MKKELEFLKLIEKLKLELRHSWLSDGQRQESVAEHSWRLAMMAFRYSSQLDQPVNLEKCLKLALVHDLGEAEAGDIPVFDCQSATVKKSKYENEHAAMLKIKNLLGDGNGNEIYDLWLEFENQKTYESRFVRALDKLEAFIQHNEAPLSTWEEREKRMLFQEKWLIKHCQFDSFLKKLCQSVLDQGHEKLKSAKEDLVKIKEQAEEEAAAWQT